ncbi:MAG: hypothetical protein K2O45_12165 [Oscillospiraceae bacterium]|nr:hypothetical protein [Oscillospiraceae bacterium]
MKKIPLRTAGQAVSLLLTACLLSGCAALLERSYSVTEPYADRYWDSGAEDTLRAESYQDLVNSLLLLVEERAEEGVIRCYGAVGEYQNVMAAREEVRQETTQGSYLLRDLRLSHESGANYSTVTCYMTYREDAEDIDSIMSLSDSQSLVDLLRLAVREEHEKLTVQFYDTNWEDVTTAVESLWQELCRAEMETVALAVSGEGLPQDASEEDADGDGSGQQEDQPGEEAEPSGDASSSGETESPEKAGPEDESAMEELREASGTEGPDEPAEPPIEYPPCPWQVKFYPNQDTARIVEVILKAS